MSNPSLESARPSRRTSSTPRVVHLATVIALAALMVLGGFLVLVPLASAGAVAAAATDPTSLPAPRPVISGTPNGVQSGASLQNGPFLTNPGTPFTGLNNVSGTSPLPSTTPVQFTVGFQLQNATELAQVIQDQQTPGSPGFHHWLTLAQEQRMFGPNPVIVQNTINYFTSLGFTVGTQGPISVSFTGTSAQVDQAFRTQMQGVQFQNGSESAMNTAPLSLPAAIAGGISTVNGLDRTLQFHPTHSVNPQLGQAITDLGGTPALSANSPLAQLYANISTVFNNSNHAFLWMHFYSHVSNKYYTWQTLTPGALTYLYNGTQLINQGINGNSTGRPINIAIVMAGGINPGDLTSYGQLVWNNPNNILHRLTPMPIDGAFTTNGTVTYTDGASGEMALDIEYSSTMAPGAHITAVYGPCLCTNVLDDDYAVLDSLVTVPNIISNSWGGEEDTSGNIYGPNYQNDQTMHYYFALLDARGATILASSADGGGFDKTTGILSGSFPATDPYVLSIDGVRTAAAQGSQGVFPTAPTFGLANVTVYTRANYPNWIGQATQMAYQSYWYEPVSNTTVQTLPPNGSGGFGTSYWFNQSWWQHAPGVPDLGRSLGSGVAAEADFNQTIFFDGGFQFFYGGTSFACPTTAGELALIEDYLVSHGTTAYPGYLGNGNIPVWTVANAWMNHNLTLIPFFDVKNGTSFWGNRGVSHGYSWPPGQEFPMNSTTGAPAYGDTLPGYDFPTGWGTINVANFAFDLNYLYSLPGTFMTLNSAGTAWNVAGWGNMVLNSTYNLHVNTTSAIALSSPHVTIEYTGSDGVPHSSQPPLTPVLNGQQFTLDTHFPGPGLVVLELGNSTSRMIGFAYTWIAAPLPVGGTLNITVVNPGSSSIVGGYPEFSTVPGYSFFAPPISLSPGIGPLYPNSFTVRVTLNGSPVYNAVVTAATASSYSFAWQGSRFQNVSDSEGRPYEKTFNIVSQSFTNVSGYAIVQTWNVIQPTTFYVNASYSSAKASTTFNVVPGPNIRSSDSYGGKFSNFNTVNYLLQYYRLNPTPQLENLYVPNSVNQSGYYSMIYGWAGEELPVQTNNYQGQSLSGIKVWLATLDVGGENKFYHYAPSYGLFGVTNTSGTSNYTDPSGNTTLQIPDNMTGQPFYTTAQGNLTYAAYIAASVPGESNRTFSYTEPCAPTLHNINPIITCYFNNSYSRNYTSIPLLVLPNPVDAWTETPALVHRDFFNVGQNLSWAVNVNLPTNDPFVNGYGYNWASGTEHIMTVRAYVDGTLQGDMSPWVPPDWQTGFHAFENFSGTFRPGVHILKVVVTDSQGHIFTNSHTFIVGSVNLLNLGITNTYTVVPYTVNWSLDLPSSDINNHTFNSSFNIRYIAPGCGGIVACPAVANLSERIHDGQTHYNQSINATLLHLNNFYSGEDQLPPGQYQVIVWLSINGTHGHVNASISAAITTYFVFTSVNGEINGPTPDQVVPLGNVTISYSYSGDYVSNASLFVFSASQRASPVFTVGAFVPGIGLRGGAASWPAVQTGTYLIVLSLGTPYGHYNATQWINVSLTSGTVYLNQTHANGPLGSMNPAAVATALALVAAILGLIVGLFVAPTLRGGLGGGPTGKGPAAPPKAWEEGTPGGVQAAARPESEKPTCSVCHDTFESAFAMHQHQKIVHGIEE